jgi:Na+-driven multidrug efflux pump
MEPQMMGIALLQGMGRGVHAMTLTLSREVLLVVPSVLLLSRLFGVVGAFCAEPASDALALSIAVPLLYAAYRAYPPADSNPIPEVVSPPGSADVPAPAEERVAGK